MGARFVPTGHADLDQLRRDGLAGCAPWWLTTAAGAAAGLTLVIAVPLVFLVYAGFEGVIIWLQQDGGAARLRLAGNLGFALQYARYAWLSGLAMAAVGGAYALLRRWTVLRLRYVRVGPWEVGAHTVCAAAAGYGAFFLAAQWWPPLRLINTWLLWAWGPVLAWLLGRLQDAYILWLARPGWRLEVESTVRVLIPRRFRCPSDRLRVQADPVSRTVAVAAEIDQAEANRARELIQAIPDTVAVTVQALGRQESAAALERPVRSAAQWPRHRFSGGR
ncbi:MAG TPA: hypothetical protein VIK93_03785 [Limnochordales bacterium]